MYVGRGDFTDCHDTMAEWSKALVLGTSLRAWVRIPLVSIFIPFLSFIRYLRDFKNRIEAQNTGLITVRMLTDIFTIHKNDVLAT